MDHLGFAGEDGLSVRGRFLERPGVQGIGFRRSPIRSDRISDAADDRSSKGEDLTSPEHRLGPRRILPPALLSRVVWIGFHWETLLFKGTYRTLVFIRISSRAVTRSVRLR